MSSKMPKDFLWGGAIAAHQAEGLECRRTRHEYC